MMPKECHPSHVLGSRPVLLASFLEGFSEVNLVEHCQIIWVGAIPTSDANLGSQSGNNVAQTR